MPSNAIKLKREIVKKIKSDTFDPRKEVRKIVGVQLLKNLAKTTPINRIQNAKTRGDLNGSWTASQGRPAARKQKNVARVPIPAELMNIQNAEDKKTIYIANSTPYALSIENGTNSIAPRRYTRLALLQLVKQMKAKNIKVKVLGS